MTVKHHAIIIPDRSSPGVVSLSSTTLESDGTETDNPTTVDDETGNGRAGIVSFDPPGGDMHPQLVGGDARAAGRIGVLTPGTLDSARWSVTHSDDGSWWCRTSPQVFSRPFVAMRHWMSGTTRNMGASAGLAYAHRVRLATNGETVLCAQGYGDSARERDQRIRGLAVQVGPDDGWPIVYQSTQDTGWWSREDLWTMVDFDICGDPDTREWVFVGVYARGESGRKMVIARSRDGAEWVTVGEFSVGYEPEGIPSGDISLPGGNPFLFTSCAVAKSTGRSLAILVSTNTGVFALYSRDGGRTVQSGGEISDQNADFSTLSITTLRDGSFWAMYAFGWVNEGATRSNIYSMYSRSGEGWTLNDAIGFDAWEAPKAWTICPVQRPDGHGQVYCAGRSWLINHQVKRAIIGTRAFADADIYVENAGGFKPIDLGDTEPGGEVLQIHPVYGCDDESSWLKGAPEGVGSYHIGPVDVAAVEHKGRLYVAVGTNVEYDDGGRKNDGGATIVYESNRWSPVAAARGLTWEDDWYFRSGAITHSTTHGRPYHIHWSPVAYPNSLNDGWGRALAAGGSESLDDDLELDQGVFYFRSSIPNYNGGDADNAQSHESERSFLFEAELRVINGGSVDSNRIAIDVQMVDDDGFTSALVVRFERESATSIKIRAVHTDGFSDATLIARDDEWITVWGGHEEKGGYYTVYAQVGEEEAVEVLSVSGVLSPGGVALIDEHIRWGHISAHVDSQSAWRLFQIQRATGAARDAKGSPMPPFRLLTEDDFDSTAGGVTPPLAEDTISGVAEQITADSGVFNYDMPCRTRTWAIDADVVSASWRGISTSIGSWSWTCEQQSGAEAAVGSPIRPGRYAADRIWSTTAGTRHGSRVLTLDVDGIRFDSIAVFRRNWPACTIEAYHPDLGEWVGIDVGPSEAGIGVELRDTSLWRATGGNDGFRAEAAEYGFDLVHASLTTDGPLPIGRLEPDVDRGIRYYATGIYPMGSDDRMHVWSIRGNSARTIFTDSSPSDVASFWNLGATWTGLLDVRQSLAIYSDRFALDLSPIISPHVADQAYRGRPTQLRITIHPHVRGDGDAVKTGTILLGQLFDLTRPGFGTSVDQSWQTGAVHSAGQRGIVRAEREHPILRSWSVACQYLPPMTRPEHEDGIATNSAERIEAIIAALRLGAGREIAWVPDSDLLTPNGLGNEGDPGDVTPLVAAGPTSAAWRELALARLSPSVDVGTTIMQGVPDASGACRGLPVHSTRFKIEEV